MRTALARLSGRLNLSDCRRSRPSPCQGLPGYGDKGLCGVWGALAGETASKLERTFQAARRGFTCGKPSRKQASRRGQLSMRGMRPKGQAVRPGAASRQRKAGPGLAASPSARNRNGPTEAGPSLPHLRGAGSRRVRTVWSRPPRVNAKAKAPQFTVWRPPCASAQAGRRSHPQSEGLSCVTP